MNDPNGCVFFRGRYHLFFQHHPYSTSWGPMHWGHASSSDLVHWNEQRIALYPDEQLGMAFSGSIAIDKHNSSGLFPAEAGLVAIFTSHRPATDTTPTIQQQSLAWSGDEGITWSWYEGNPIIPNPGVDDFRDPRVLYHEPSGAWVLVLVAGREVRFYRSLNLFDWEYTSSFSAGNTGGIWECPDLFPLPDPRRPENTVWVLAVSAMGPPTRSASALQYFLGSFDGYRFTNGSSPQRIRYLDGGHDFYAAQSWYGLPSAEERTIWIAWANHWKYAHLTPTDPWRGVMTIPREVRLERQGNDLVLAQRPVRELNMFRTGTPTPIVPGRTVVLDDLPAWDIHLLIENPLGGSVAVEVSFGDGEVLDLCWDGDSSTLTLDRSALGTPPFHPAYAEPAIAEVPVNARGDTRLDVRIILDRSIVEVFALHGVVVLTSQIFPKESPGALEATAHGRSRLAEAGIAAIVSAYPERDAAPTAF